MRLKAVDDANVAKNSWWVALCPKHGETQHLSYIGGACVECQKERLQQEGKDVQKLTGKK